MRLDLEVHPPLKHNTFALDDIRIWNYGLIFCSHIACIESELRSLEDVSQYIRPTPSVSTAPFITAQVHP